MPVLQVTAGTFHAPKELNIIRDSNFGDKPICVRIASVQNAVGGKVHNLH